MHRVSVSQTGLLREYTLDAALMGRPGNQDIQLDPFLNYANKVKLYPHLRNTSGRLGLGCLQSGGRMILTSFQLAPRLSSATTQRGRRISRYLTLRASDACECHC